MQIVDAEIPRVETKQPPQRFNYNKENPIWGLVAAIESTQLAAGRQHYLADSLQYLLPYDDLFLAGPGGDDWETKDPRQQENKNDFQKQNVRGYRLTGTQVTRGYATAGDWTGTFVRISHAPTPDSPLTGPDGLVREATIVCSAKLGSAPWAELVLPYNEASHRYEAELWSFPGPDLRPLLDGRGKASIDRGELQVRADLVKGSLADFRGPDFDRRRAIANQQGAAYTLFDAAPDHALHPLRPFHVALAFADAGKTRWDSAGGANYHYQFDMPLRGWNAYLGAGVSPNPHGGLGFLEFRNLFSNYFGHEATRRQAYGPDTLPELARELNPWTKDAGRHKPPTFDLASTDPTAANPPPPTMPEHEPFLAVEYMDLHILRRDAGIGIHRHRDSQEVFLLLSGKGLMVMGDWCEFPDRRRAFEIRTMLPGDLTLCKAGRLHALLNVLDEDTSLFMFGGYD